MSNNKFDTDVPIPRTKGPDKYGLADFPINGSKFFEVSPDMPKHFRYNIITQAQKKNPGCKFTVRTVVESGKKGYRVWRVA